MDWPLRAKMAALLVVASIFPLGVAALVDIREARRRLVANAAALLAARGDQLVGELDTFHRGFQRSATRFSRLPRVLEFARTTGLDSDRVETTIDAVLAVQPGSDPRVRGAAILDLSGKVTAATEQELVGKDLSYHAYIHEALKSGSVISDIHLEREAGDAPTIAYLEPVRATRGGEITALFAIWVRATALWDVMKASNGLAGPGSFAVMFDEEGIRIAHTYSDDIVFHPGGQIDPSTVDALAAESRFGRKTRELLEDVRAFPEQFDRARSASPDTGVFRGLAPVNQKWNYGVARRFETVPWTVFYMLPEDSLNAEIQRLTRARTLFAGAIILVALGAGVGSAALILRPIRSLSAATQVIAGGNLGARVAVGHADEVGRLGTSFNAMAERVEAQATALEKARDELELRVQERTAELVKTTKDLELEAAERERAQVKLRAQLERLNLLHDITRAIGERLDLHSIFQIVIRSVEDNLPVDFSCLCLHDPVSRSLTVSAVGTRSEELARDLALPEQSRVPVDENGLSKCIAGQLVYEPDISQVPFPFPQRLSRAGLRSLVIAPLAVESQVFGVFVAARFHPQAFDSGECAFLKQLTQHVALAAHQSQLYGALQQAYDDLRQTQQAVMQQERLRALGQMASGIAHDINNAISPVALYTESLLEREPNLSARAREYLETIQHAVDDVGQTVGRMREFYRQREPQLSLAPVHLSRLVQQVIDLSRARWSDMPQQRGVVITLVTELAADLPAVMGVESEIREALINLVFNAVDAMPEGGTLTLRTQVSADGAGGAQVHVEVTDSGLGMDEETRRQCLEPFFTTKGDRGTGLGLAMVYGVVKRHSAEIEIESAVGAGTTVRLTFPAATAAALVAESGAALPHAVVSRLRILVVDDDPLLLKSLRDTLEDDGHVVVTANLGQAGIDAFGDAQERKEPFAVVITDLGMPYVDGRKVASAVKLASPSTPVILLTGWGQRLVAEGDVPEHVDRVLSKPPKLRELRETLAQLSRGSGR
jgi:signal transduction histidine kinase/ActR/RegA family two-component response regulator